MGHKIVNSIMALVCTLVTFMGGTKPSDFEFTVVMLGFLIIFSIWDLE